MGAGELDERDLTRKRPGNIAGVVIGIIAMTLFASGCGSDHSTPKPASAPAQSTTAEGAQAQTASAESTQARRTHLEVASLLAGIPQRGNTLGDPKAPVTLQYFADLECPYCRRFTLGVLPLLIRRYVRGGRLKVEYRSLETATRNAETFKIQQVAALAAGKQNKMWDFIDLFYHEQGQESSGYVTERYLQGLAQQVSGLNLIEWAAARADPELAEALAGDAQAASNAGIRITPSFLIARAANTPYLSAIEKLLRS
jgi:protein-disulfide isomerase